MTHANAVVTPMPPLLRALLVLLAVSSAVAVAGAVFGDGISGWVSVAIHIGAIVGLLKGSEGVRAVLRGLSGIGLAVGGYQVLQAIQLLQVVGTAALLAVAAATMVVVIAAFMFWTLGRDDVRTWILQRSVGAA